MKPSRKFCFVAALMLAVGIAYIAQADAPTFVYETVVDDYDLASGHGMAVDPDGNAYVIARTIGNGNDILVIKVGAQGTVLWTHSIAGNEHDYATGIALDEAHDVYVAGWTDSDDFPLVNALDETLTGFRDAFVMKLSTLDGSIVFSTYLGGDYADEARGIALNDDGEIYLVGKTESSDFPTVDPIQDQLNGPPYQFSDAFITRLAADGSEILYSTYLGGSRDDIAVGVALDDDDNIYFAGGTLSDDFPLQDALQSAPAGDEDIFAVRLSADGTTLDFSTYLGGEDWDRVGGIALDPAGHLYIGGSTRSITFPTTAGAYQEEFVGEILGCEVPFGADYNCDDIFVTKLAPDGSTLAYSTFIGGSTTEECRDLAIDSAGCAVVVGYSASSDYPPDGIDTAAEIVVTRLVADGSDISYTVTVDSQSPNAGHGVAIDDADDVYFTGAVNAPADVYIAKFSTSPATTAVDRPDAGLALRLEAVAPNPFNPRTKISFTVDRQQEVQIAVFDLAGRRVAVLTDGVFPPGAHSVDWNGRDAAGGEMPSGNYFVRLSTVAGVQGRKMTLLR